MEGLNVASLPQQDDIKVEYHPSSGRPTKIHRFEDFKRQASAKPPAPDSEEPWLPFRSREDFEFAEIALDAALNQRQTDALISFIHRCVKRQHSESFTLSNHAEMLKLLDAASTTLTSFTKHTVSAEYQKETMKFEVWIRPLWDWALDLLRDPRLAPHFVWDAERLSKFNGTSFVRFIDEPWTANTFWDVQSVLPAGAKLFCIILYADKTKLSSFGTAKGYPVMARCANLPVEIRNGEGVGGGRVVGWLPILEEDEDKTGKKTYVNFKNIIWHKSFYLLLEKVIEIAKDGFHFTCADDVLRWLFPIILILSADYEEQCVMALIRGLKGKCPCPICLVPSSQLAELSERHPFRTVAATKALVEDGSEEELKKHGLRKVENVFWKIPHSDPYQALSFDCLHAYHLGLFGRHLLPEIQAYLNRLERETKFLVDDQINRLPRWRGLNHFPKVVKTTFTDGVKFEDISKQIIFACHNILSPDPTGHLLLQCLRSYLNLDMYAGLEVQTPERLQEGREEILRFSYLINSYWANTLETSKKNWAFPKMHTHVHLFDDIEAKGVSRNFNTKPNEKLHRPLKQSYQLRTNFKDVAKQILRVDHHSWVLTSIRDQVDELDKFLKSQASLKAPEDSDDALTLEASLDSKASESIPDDFAHIKLGSKQKRQSFQLLKESWQDDIAFRGFRRRLNLFLYENGVLDGPEMSLQENHLFTEYRFLKVNYESMVDWRQACDYLRCSPNFHNRPRYDCAILDTVAGPIFGRLLFLFIIEIGETTYPIALVHPLDAPFGPPQPQDLELGLFRLRARPREASEFFFCRSIIRGALVVPDNSRTDRDLLINDLIDGDMYLRIQDML
ncbi:hypothetical protein BV25DRAFT_1816053 [Artomyces pyxidatus]|uniref:Uncharacterized protein n=1 Tax=Artomyces pyxidatus TaxID=48021 RepID=A0ACB8SFV3_9AGAM|nr:hypothetical protein BV25DRAFT_1816053 [Artomyces pyxidatus]